MGRVVAILVVASASFAAYYISSNLQTHYPPPKIRNDYYGPGQKKTDNTAVEKFTISVSYEDLTDLRRRLENARTFTALEGAAFHYGFNTAYLEKVRKYWLDGYDWRKHESLLNKFGNYRTEIEGLKVHFIHAKPPPKKYKRVLPLLLVHGWPGSVYEFHKILPLLTDPAASSKLTGIPKDTAFEVIAPSIPGYGWSDAPAKQGFNNVAAARLFSKLMDRLGHKRFYCQGGDWGSVIVTALAAMYPQKVVGLHINMAIIFANTYPMLFVKTLVGIVAPSLVLDANDIGKAYPMGEHFLFALQESGYMHIQSTKPDTVALALNDSPLGLAAYIIEKFSTWTNRKYRQLDDGGLTRHFTFDQLLTNVMIYWTTGSIASSQRFYKEHWQHPDYETDAKASILVPTACAMFPEEILMSPRKFLEYKFKNITRYTDMARGGHFAAFEEPVLLADDVFAFAASLESS